MGGCRGSAHRNLDDHGKHIFITQEHLFKNSNTRIILFCAFFVDTAFVDLHSKKRIRYCTIAEARILSNSSKRINMHSTKVVAALGSLILLRPLCARLWRNLAEDVHIMWCKPHVEWISESCGDYEPRRYRVHACYGPRR